MVTRIRLIKAVTFIVSAFLESYVLFSVSETDVDDEVCVTSNVCVSLVDSILN